VTEEERVRSLLTAAAELPDLGPAPVEQLIASGRRRRVRTRILTATAAAAAVVAAVTIPAVIHGAAAPPGSEAPRYASPGTVPPGVSAAELAHGHWTRLPASPLANGDLGSYVAAWASHELVVTGYGGGPNKIEGAAYVPGAGWHVIAPAPPSHFDVRDMFWAGDYLIVLRRGPRVSQGSPAVLAAIYAAGTNSWSVTPFPLPTGSARDPELIAAAQLGNQLVFAEARAGKAAAYSYSVSARSWRPVALSLPAGHKVSRLEMVAVGGRLVLLSSWDDAAAGSLAASGTSGVDVRILGPGGSWRALPGWPAELADFSVAGPAAGGRLLLVSSLYRLTFPAYLVDGATLAVGVLPASPSAPRQAGYGQLKLTYSPTLWTGAAVVAFAPDYRMNFGPEIFHDNMVALDPATGRWYRLPSGPPHYDLAWPLPPVWGGDTMYVTNGTVLWSFGP
jgi:hypothetical protein